MHHAPPFGAVGEEGGLWRDGTRDVSVILPFQSPWHSIPIAADDAGFQLCWQNQVADDVGFAEQLWWVV